MEGTLGFFIFTLIRKKIFYALNPLEAARRFTPYLVFVVVVVLALVLVFEGLKNQDLNLNFMQKTFLTVGLGASASLLSYFLMKRISSSPKEAALPLYASEVISSLEKARKHLQRVKLATHGEMQYHTGLALGEVEDLAQFIYEKKEITDSHSEYLKVEKIFSYLQIISACMMAFAHGANDVANAIGPLSAAVGILTTGILAVEAPVPTWALALGGIGIVIGLATWGWRVIDTIGKKITELTPSRGFSAEFGAATTIVLASRLGLPISTTPRLWSSHRRWVCTWIRSSEFKNHGGDILRFLDCHRTAWSATPPLSCIFL